MLEGLLESAHRYAVAANVLMCYSDLGAEAEVNAALGMGLLLKSLVPWSADSIVEQARGGYPLNVATSEDLVLLYGRIDRSIRVKLDLREELHMIVRKRGIVISGTGKHSGVYAAGDNELVYCLGRLIPKVVEYFKALGSQHTWVLAYPAIHEAVTLRTGITQERSHVNKSTHLDN